MPEFFAEHVPEGMDDFTRGYLECAEWLANAASDRPDPSLTDAERARCKGFTRDAIRRAKRDCRDFQQSNATDLAEYEEATGRGMVSAGHDFWLTRNHHGAGFWDRGSHPCLTRLTEASHGYGECECEMYRGYLHLT